LVEEKNGGMYLLSYDEQSYHSWVN
jgi:hypothetical protein